MTKIVFLDKGTFPSTLEAKKPSFPHEWQEFEGTPKDQIIPRLQGADIAITNKVKLDDETLSSLPDLKMIAIAATGFDHVDIHSAHAKDITVANVKGYAVNSVPEHAMMMIMALSRSLLGFQSDIEKGEWQKANQFCFFNHPIEDLHDKTLGIIGRGVLGAGLARLASGFGMGIMYAGRRGDKNPHKPYIEFDEFLEQSDIISIHCPLNDHTRDLITKNEFSKMSRNPILINASRGGIVNEADAVDAVNQRKIRALGVDCLSLEPPRNGNPLLSIAHYPNVIITPHIAWASTDAVQSLWDNLINNIEDWKKGDLKTAL
jgi:glycerate dehydrogenase